ncbi:MAG TPA: substrate-binding domain-containing protein [Candidatus Baltobacteraceae bacterium]|nr:substrate-binding domain-containing protein [Candidatus Baltobacteraceae bacterium]
MRYLAIAALFILCACSATGGARSRSGTVANIPRLRIAMVTHQAPGDTFWDIVRHGAEAAAANDDVNLIYSNDPSASAQAVLIQNAIDQRVDGIAVTLPAPDALAAAVKRAQRAGIPVIAFNAGFDAWKRLGIPMYIGQDEEFAGRTAGQRLSAEGAKHVLCVVQFQGQVQLEARCKGLQEGLNGARSEKIYVNGADMPSVRSTITAKLQEDPSIDYVATLGAPIALTAVQAVKSAGSKAHIVTFDTNKQLVRTIQNGSVQWAIDQQPYLQGYEAVDTLWLLITNGDVLGGGRPILTGPTFIDSSNVGAIAQYAAKGTR